MVTVSCSRLRSRSLDEDYGLFFLSGIGYLLPLTGSQNNSGTDFFNVLKLCFQSKHPRNLVDLCKSYLRYRICDYPITFTDAIIRLIHMVLTFTTCVSVFSYALKVLATYD